MFINRLNQLYKPKRILFYVEAGKEDISAFGKGKSIKEIEQYSNKFGVYDYPGLFYIDSFDSPVIGIELRMDDERIDYPENLKSVILDEAFYYSVEVDAETYLDINNIRSIFINISKDNDAHRQYDDLSICENPRVISVFYHDEKFRILYEWKLDEDRAKDVINDNFEKFDKEMLYKTSFFDPITGHYNWNHLVPYLEMPMDAGIRDYAFAHFDIKEFRIVNEVYGHIAGNNVLSKVVKAMNESDFVYTSARCHNDNFAMIICDMPTEELVKKLEEFFDNLSVLDEDPNYKISYRCGVVPMPRSLLFGNRVADAGKLAQKMGTKTNKTDIVVYTDEMHDDILWGNYIKAYVDTAVKNDEFVVYLQPKFDIKTEKIKGAEALIRWNYKHRNLLAPFKFIPFFEKDGTISKIDDIVLHKVCEALARWKKEGKPLYPVSVNLSRTRMYDEGLVDYLESIVDSYGVDHSLIDFELTESASYDDTEQMINVLLKLREKHFELSMDDFGTGYSSLSLLTRMPMDTLKIDKSFVDKVGTESDRKSDIAVIRHIISLAKELGFVCLAEGAEKKEQIDKLKELGCDIVQGYYYSRPISLMEFENSYLKSFKYSPAK
ncbi:MAG: GGDEF domain-containing phosphodiesterase [Lachnospiraceae bacterium]|nr:GGDEF domain-containing phosphodiesterase [Lachnospiraceae bacterium]